MRAGRHGRPPADGACSHFFPRSVGFGPTASWAKGAFIIAPSMLCHLQAMPSISSYSESPARHSASKKPASSHSRNRLWMALALPNRSLGMAFHWHPVRNTYTMPSKTCRGGFAGRPAPGFLTYFFPAGVMRGGISGATRSQKASVTTHDSARFAMYLPPLPQIGGYGEYITIYG